VIPCASCRSGTNALDFSWNLWYHTCMKDQNTSEVYHYHTNWKEGKVNQMWIQKVEDKYVAIAYNPEKNCSMVMSKPRTSYSETLNWVRGWCGTFCVLPV
jgi:hypothetical protein